MEESFLVKSMRAILEKEKQEEFALKPIKTLGEVILLLKMQPSSNFVRFDFTSDNPQRLHSYRGYYSDLALGHEPVPELVTVGQLLKRFEDADGRTFTGYKGGDFTMHRKTLVWVASYGNTGRMLVDIQSKDGVTTIITQEDYEVTKCP